MAVKLGQMLVEAGVVSPDQLEAALGRQRRFGGRLATVLLATGAADERSLARGLALQLGVPCVVLSRSAIPLSLLDVLPLEVARQHRALPVHRHGRELFVAMAEPKSLAALDELRFVTGCRVVEHGALDGPLGDAIEEAYRQVEYGTNVFWEGDQLDPGLKLAGETGHVEIVVAHPAAAPSAPPEPAAAPPRPAAAQLEPGDSWVSALEAGEPVVPDSGGQRTSVLLVDDEPELRSMLRLFLEKAGYEVWEQGDGKQALAQMKHKLPDALVLDAMLPGIHGFDICYRLKNAEATRHLPVIMISAVYRGWRYENDVKALYGADAFLEKPLRLDELKRTLEAALAAGGGDPSSDELSHKAQAALHQAAKAYKSGDLKASAAQLEAAVTAAPFSAQLHHRLGLLYEKLDEPHRAIAALERGAELDPSYAHLLALARLYEKTGFIHKAFEAWERCLRACDRPQEAATIKRHIERLLP